MLDRYELNAKIISVQKVNDKFEFLLDGWDGKTITILLEEPIVTLLSTTVEYINHHSSRDSIHDRIPASYEFNMNIQSYQVELNADDHGFKSHNPSTQTSIQDLLNQVIQKQKENSER